MSKLPTIADRVRDRRAELGLTQNELANLADMSQQGIQSIERGDSHRPRRLRELARALQVTEDWLLGSSNEAQPVQRGLPFPQANASPTAPMPQLSGRRIPVFGHAVGGDDGRFQFNGEMIDTVVCPPGLENVPNAYAVYVAGESMVPAYRPGDAVWVHPARAPRRGDDVVVQVHSTREDDGLVEGFIKEFVAWTPSALVLRQHNPPTDIELPREAVVSVHKIIGTLRA